MPIPKHKKIRRLALICFMIKCKRVKKTSETSTGLNNGHFLILVINRLQHSTFFVSVSVFRDLIIFLIKNLWSLEVVGDWLLANVQSPTTSNDQKVQKSTDGQKLPTTINTKYLQL
ncbi:hypothetical protein BpHYR1_042535, partial [Brachionus plicatilis]